MLLSDDEILALPDDAERALIELDKKIREVIQQDRTGRTHELQAEHVKDVTTFVEVNDLDIAVPQVPDPLEYEFSTYYDNFLRALGPKLIKGIPFFVEA